MRCFQKELAIIDTAYGEFRGVLIGIGPCLDDARLVRRRISLFFMDYL